MADPPRTGKSRDTDDESVGGISHWVRVIGITLVVLVMLVVVAEGVFLALSSVIVSVIPALALTGILGSGLGNLFMGAPLPYRVSALAVGIWAILGGALATDAAASRASRLTVREALAYL